MFVEIYYIMKVLFQISRETIDYVIVASEIDNWVVIWKERIKLD